MAAQQNVKKVKTRVISKHDIEANWKLAAGFTPFAGEIIVYDKDNNHVSEQLKIGDGTKNVNELPFLVPFEYSNSEKNSIISKVASQNPIYAPINEGIDSLAFGGYRIDYVLENKTPDDYDNCTTIYEGANQSYAFGPGHDVHGMWNFAAGKNAKTYQRASIALGNGCIAGNENGEDTTYGSVAVGVGAKSEGYASFAAGTAVEALKKASVAVGSQTVADNDYAFAGGASTKVYAGAGFGFGNNCTVNAIATGGATFGSRNVLNNTHTYAFGQDLEANATYCVAIGHYNKGATDNYFEVGNGGSDSSRKNAFEITQTGVARAYGTPSGDNDLITVKYFNDNKPTLTLPAYLAQRKPYFGYNHTVDASCTDVLVSGRENNVNSTFSIVGGYKNKATGQKQYVGGDYNEVTNTLCFAHGQHLIVNKWGQYAFGVWNNPETGATFMVGNGTKEENRKNAFEVYADGKVCVQKAPDGTDPTAVVRYQEIEDLSGEIQSAVETLSETLSHSVDIKLETKADLDDLKDLELVADNITFAQDLKFTEAFGKYKPDSSGIVVIPTKTDKMSLTDLLLNAYATDKDPTITLPNAQITFERTGTFEVGETIQAPTINFSGGSLGSYSYGPATTGSTWVDFTYSGNGISATKVTYNGTAIKRSVGNNITIKDNTNIIITGKAKYSAATQTPKTALGNDYASGKFASATSDASASITGFRYMLFRTFTNIIDVNSNGNEIRTTTGDNVKPNSDKSYTGSYTLDIPQGTKQVIIAIPVSASSVITSIKETGFNMEIKDDFKHTTTQIRGASAGSETAYDVYTYTALDGLAANTFTIQIQ